MRNYPPRVKLTAAKLAQRLASIKATAFVVNGTEVAYDFDIAHALERDIGSTHYRRALKDFERRLLLRHEVLEAIQDGHSPDLAYRASVFAHKLSPTQAAALRDSLPQEIQKRLSKDLPS